MSKVFMTPAGFLKLREDLHRYKHQERPRVIRDIEEAIAHGDLSENSEFESAKERQSFIEGRIRELEMKLASAEVIDPSKLSGDRVVFGATVYLLDNESGETVNYQIVGADEADVKAGRISFESPIGRALMGKRVEDEVRVQVPRGVREFEIVEIQFK